MKWLVAVALWLHDLIASPKFFRRTLLTAAIVYLGMVCWRVVAPEVLLHITPAGASVVVAIIGTLATICMLYQYLRDKDER